MELTKLAINQNALWPVDSGRVKDIEKGFSRSGPLDTISFRWCNYLLGNHLDAVCLETIQGGFQLFFQKECMISYVGSDINLFLNDNKVLPNRSFFVPLGSTLISKGAIKGQFVSYLGVKDGFKASKYKNSVCLPYREKPYIEHYDTDILYSSSNRDFNKKIPYYFEDFTSNLYYYPNHDFEIEQEITIAKTNQIDRICLKTNMINSIKISHDQKASEPVTKGTIQIPNNHELNILLADSQTVGGYNSLGCLTLDSIKNLLQAPINNEFTLQPISNDLSFKKSRGPFDFLL